MDSLNVTKILLVYYSRTGTTRKVAEAISSKLNSDIEEIRDVKSRGGILGWLKAGRDAGDKNLTVIEGLQKDPGLYDVVLIGTPIWRGTVSTPIRTYINQYRERLKLVAFFSIGDDPKSDVFEEMTDISGKEPITTLRLWRKGEVESGEYLKKLQGFTDKILETMNMDKAS